MSLDSEHEHHAFWADEVADRIEARLDRTDANEPVVIKGGISPSGVPHLGHANEIMRGYFVAEVLRERRAARAGCGATEGRDAESERRQRGAEGSAGRANGREAPVSRSREQGGPARDASRPSGSRRKAPTTPDERTGNEVTREHGHKVRQVFTSDDRDPLRKIPRTLADLDWEVVNLGDVPNPGVLGRNLGHPLTDVPDPFECCESFGDHQTRLLESMTAELGVPVEIRSTTALYEEGKFDTVIRELLEKRERAREVLAEYQASVRETDEYVPFNPICEHCGKLTETVTAVDAEAGTVEYTCTDFEAGNQVIEGCDHEGTATIRDGKLPWRFEWPAQWKVLDVDFEPFGKDHAEGSWPSGEAIAREVLDFEPPEPMVYEWFTLNGKPLSSSSGHIITVPDVLELVEPEALYYFFTKNPTKARDFDVSRLDQLVDEFDRFERVYFGKDESDENARAERIYPFVVEEIRAERIRLPYTFAAVLGMTDDRALREEMARRENHIPEDAPEWAVEDALACVERARTWAERTDNAYNYRLETELPPVEFDSDTEAALSDLAEFVEAGHDGEAVQGEIFETARRHDLAPGELFTAGYRLFLGTEQGPKLGPFLTDLDREFVVRRLRREG